MSTKLVVVGGGKMGEALVSGVLRARWARARDITVVETVEARRAQLIAAHPDVVVSTTVPPGSDGAVIAVKPVDVPDAAGALVAARPRRVLSIAAGVATAHLEAVLGDIPVLRAMPNTPALIGAGAAALAAGRTAGPADMEWAEGVLASVGVVVRVTEKMLDAVTGLSGSGPAYVFLVAELLDESGDLPEALRAAVTSPAGTTAAGLRVLEQRSVRAAFLDAVLAAAERSRELGCS